MSLNPMSQTEAEYLQDIPTDKLVEMYKKGEISPNYPPPAIPTIAQYQYTEMGWFVIYSNGIVTTDIWYEGFK